MQQQFRDKPKMAEYYKKRWAPGRRLFGAAASRTSCSCGFAPPTPPSPSPPPIPPTNVLTPNGPLGNAQGFTWTSSLTTGRGSGALPPNVADGVHRTVTSTWTSYGYQQGASAGDQWIQVTLPSAVVCTDAAVVGYPGSSHMPSGASAAYIQASTDGSSWGDVARWTTHPGCSQAFCTVNDDGANMGYTTVMDSYSTYKIDFSQAAKETPYMYWRVGGAGWTNTYLLIYNWILQCRVPSQSTSAG